MLATMPTMLNTHMALITSFTVAKYRHKTMPLVCGKSLSKQQA